MKSLKQSSFPLVVLSVLALSACGSQGELAPVKPQQEHASEQAVRVQSGDLIATVSSPASVQKDAAYTLITPERGRFTPKVRAGEEVKAGEILALSGESEITAPADSRVSFIQGADSDLPANYPAIALTYTGFSLPVRSEASLKLGHAKTITGAFQITDGLGPSECIAVVSSASPIAQKTESESGSSEGAEIDGLTCLIAKSAEVKQGENATVVLHGTKKTGVLTLPLNAVAGREHKGQVARIVEGKVVLTDVGLGISDGAQIEITSGLNAGDEVRAVAPNLDPRGK